MAWRGEKIALIGDLHGRWNRLDNQFFNEANYDLLLFVGDLGSGTLGNQLSIIRLIAQVSVPGLVLPGNNDAEFLAPLAAELAHQSGANALRELAGIAPATYLEPCGYSNHEIETDSGSVTLIVARPCAMGGSEFSFPSELERNYGVASLEESARRLKKQVDAAATEAIVFMGHNGPFGLGGEPGDLWARDFSLPDQGGKSPPLDWGDTDLEQAVEYARSRGKDVLGVIGGHLHRTRASRSSFSLVRDGTVYLNPAVVPRITAGENGELHHFVEVVLRPGAAHQSERFVAKERWVEL